MNIAILSTNPELYSTKRLVEAAIKRGHNAFIVDHNRCNLVMEKGKPAIQYNGMMLENIDAVVPRIGASVSFFGSAVVRHFENMKIFSSLNPVALIRSRDKLRSLQMLSKIGLGIPKSVFAKFPKDKDVDNLIDLVGGAPLVIKVLEGTQGLGVVLADTRQSAKSMIEAFSGLKENILIQEFIKEAGGADIRAFVVDGKVVAAMKRQGTSGDFRSNLHRGGHAQNIELSKKEYSAAIEAAKCLGLSIAGVDMMQGKNGPLILEVNSSPGLEGIEKTTKVDVADEIIQFVERGAEKMKKKKSKKKKNGSSGNGVIAE